MKTKALFPVLIICLALAGLAAGCGDDGSSDTATVTETTTEAEGAAQAGDTTGADDDAASAEDETAPSGDAVRSAKVEIDDFAYEPDTVTIEEGGKVIWVNRDSAPHTATAEDGSFDTGTLEEGKLGSATFKQAGTYEYVCSIHPEMHGTVEVVPAG